MPIIVGDLRDYSPTEQGEEVTPLDVTSIISYLCVGVNSYSFYVGTQLSSVLSCLSDAIRKFFPSDWIVSRCNNIS